MSYITPLTKRLSISRSMRKRYWSDPEFRLRKINSARESQGLAPRASMDEIGKRG